MAPITRCCRPSPARLLVLGLFLVVGLSACNDEKPRALLDQHAGEAQKAMQDMNDYAPAKRYNPLVVTDKVWAGSSALRMHRGLPLPAKYEADRGVTLVSADPMSLAEIANAIQIQTGIPVRIADAGGPVNGGPGGGGSAKTGPTMPIAYEGPLSGLLEKVAGYFGVNWKFDGSIISVAKFETRVFVIEALPGTQSVSEGMQDDTGGSSSGGSGGSSGGSGGGSSTSSITQNSKFSIDFKYWDEMDQVLTSMLGGTGTIVSSPSIGTVTVTTTPEIMRSVAEYISKENDRMSRQIAVTVEIYSVSMSEGSDFDVSFSTMLKRLKNIGLNFAGGSAPATVNGFTAGTGTLTATILNPGFFQGNGTNVNGPGQITDLFTALSTIGDTSKIAKFPLVTLNNRPVSRRVGTDFAYLASATAANTTTGSTSTLGSTLTPGTIHEGFSVQLTPRLLDDGRILIEYSLSVLDLLGPPRQIGNLTTTGSEIELPQTLNRIFVSQSVLKSGSMLLLGGAEEEDLAHTSNGVGDAFNYALGGGTTSSRSHSMLVLAITPQVLEEPHSERD